MRTIKIHLTDEQYELIAHIADQEGEEIEDVIPNLVDEYVQLVHRMSDLGQLPEPDLKADE